MNNLEIKELVIKTSSDLYLRQQTVEESFIDDTLREDSDEVLACKKIVKEALTIPTFYMNTAYGYTKAIDKILMEIDHKLGTEDQDSIESFTESTIAALKEAIKQNKEYFGIDENAKIDTIYKSIREDLEDYNYKSTPDLCHNIDTMITCYKQKIHEAMNSILDKTKDFDKTKEALANAGVNESVAHNVEHLVGEFNLYMTETALKDDTYIEDLFRNRNSKYMDSFIEESMNKLAEEKENIESVFGEGFYDNKEDK